MAINGFELFIVAGNNPANLLSVLYRGEQSDSFCPCPWAAKFLLLRHNGEAAQMDLERTSVCFHPSEIDVARLEEWAIIESLNQGSYQRAGLPADIFPFLKGSGRWFANDQGGWVGLLKQKILAWVDMPGEEKARFKRAAKYVSQRPPMGLRTEYEPGHIDRGKFFKELVGSIITLRETIVPECNNFGGGPAVSIEVGLNKAEVLIGDCVPRWLADIYENNEIAEKLDQRLAVCNEVDGDGRGLVMTCGAPWEYQRTQCQSIECENCMYKYAYKIVPCTEFMQGMGVECPPTSLTENA